MNAEQIPGEELLLAEEVARILRISVADVYRLGISGEIPRKKIGRRVRFPRSALVDWMSRTEGAPDERA